MQWLIKLFPRLWTNWVTLFGAVLTTFAAAAILLLLSGAFPSTETNIYLGSFLLLALPGVFLVGLVFIPAGLWWERRKSPDRVLPLARPDSVTAALVHALQDRKVRNRFFFVAAVTVGNVFLFSVAGSKSVAHADSARFCGTTCHTVMQPEWEAYNRSPHSRVACVQCHIGPGASWAVRAKINGLKQVVGVMTGNYSRPVPTPVEHLRPSRDTCEQCHWPQKFTGNRIKLFPHYSQDQGNTPAFNAMLLKVGGENKRTGAFEGIHWHVRADTEVRYEVLDKQRKKIGKITVLDKGKVVAEYLPPGAQQPALATRTMDCIDCHNRPTHIVDITAKNAVDRAMFSGALDPKLPWLAEMAAAALAPPDLAHQGAATALRAGLEAAYKKAHADAVPAAADLDKAASALAEIYKRNVYPEMKVTWGTYTSNLGHQSLDGQKAGCFRCHDREHEWKKADGSTKSLSQSCDLCHEALATGEDPAKFEEPLQALLGGR